MGILFSIFTFSLSMISKTVTYKRVPPARAWHKPTTALYNTGAFSSSKNDMIAMPVQIPICDKIFQIIFSTAQKRHLIKSTLPGTSGQMWPCKGCSSWLHFEHLWRSPHQRKMLSQICAHLLLQRRKERHFPKKRGWLHVTWLNSYGINFF